MTINKKLAIGTAGVLAVAGTGSALAAAGHGKKSTTRTAAIGAFDHHGHPGFGGGDNLAAAADYLGVTSAALQTDLQSGKTLAQVAAATSGKSTAGLVAALVAHETTEIKAAVTAGRLTQAQADTMIAGLTARFTAEVASAGPLHGPGDPGYGPGHGPGDDLDAAAAYLGVSSTALQTDLQSGKTLAQVASATSGKSTAGLVAALVAHETTELNAAVTAGRLTQAQADTMIAGLTARFTAAAASSGPLHGPGGPGGPGDHGGPGHGPSDELGAAASYLGVTSAALLADVQSGKTLAQVAAATSGKTTAGLIAALVTHETAEINAAVTAGRLTQAQADTMIAELTQRFTDLANGVMPAEGPRGPHDGGGHRP